VIEKRYGAYLIALLGGLVLTLLAVRSVAAYSGVSGTVVDGKTNSGWQYGGEVAAYQLNAPFGPLGSTTLAANGSFALTYDDDPLGVCGGPCVTAMNGAQIVLVINFRCDLNTVNGTRPNHTFSDDANCPVSQTLGDNPVPLVGLPGGISYFYFENAGTPGSHVAGNLATNTGPTSITLRNFNAGAGGGTPVLLVAMVFLLVGGASIIAVRRRR
jgi:hypothetical protein